MTAESRFSDAFLILMLACWGVLIVGLFKPTWVLIGERRTRIRAVLAYAGLSILMFVGFGISSDAEHKRVRSSPQDNQVASAGAAARPGGPSEADAPAVEVQFCAVIDAARVDYAAAAAAWNNLQSQRIDDVDRARERLAAVRRDRGAALVRMLRSDGAVEGWVGTVTKVFRTVAGPGPGGDGWLQLTLPCRVRVMSFTIAQTDRDVLIPKESPLFATLRTLDVGQRVRFGGRFFPGPKGMSGLDGRTPKMSMDGTS